MEKLRLRLQLLLEKLRLRMRLLLEILRLRLVELLLRLLVVDRLVVARRLLQVLVIGTFSCVRSRIVMH
jgi:hypothetical protein